MFKNVATKLAVFAFDYTTGAAKTGDAAQLTCYVNKDYAGSNVLADTSASEIDSTKAPGWYLFDLAQTETNADSLLFTGKSTTANVSVVGREVFTTPANFSKLVVDAAGLADSNVVKVGPTAGGTAQTAGDLSAQIALISVATNAGDVTSKTVDAGTMTTGTSVSGSYTDTSSDNNTYWVTAPVTPAVGGFGLRQTLTVNLPLARTPTSLEIRGYWTGSGQVVDVYAYNYRTSTYDKLTNTGTNLASRTTETLYSIAIPRDYADDSGGSYNIVLLEVRTASTTTTFRLRLDRVLIYHVAEAASFTLTAPTVNDIWTAPTRTLTTPGVDPVDLSLVALEASVQSVPANVWAYVVTGTTTAVQAMRGFIAAMLGKASGLDTNAPKYRDIADTKNVISATTDASGNRTAVTTDLT